MIVTLVHRETRETRRLELAPHESLAAYMAERLPPDWSIQSVFNRPGEDLVGRRPAGETSNEEGNAYGDAA